MFRPTGNNSQAARMPRIKRVCAKGNTKLKLSKLEPGGSKLITRG